MTVVSDLPSSTTEARHPDHTSQWLRDLDVDIDTSNDINEAPSPPCSSHTEGVSTPALPPGVAESEGTATPHRFAPEREASEDTVSEATYDCIRESRLPILISFSLIKHST